MSQPFPFFVPALPSSVEDNRGCSPLENAHRELNSAAQGSREFAVKEELEKLVLQMYRSGVEYSEAVREFQSVFILTVLRDQRANQFRAAQTLGMHRNTLRRVIRKLQLDVRLLRSSTRRPPLGERAVSIQKKVGAT
jgi:Fis family transcriptional regulator, factor for inversion stimulation protein